MSMVAMVAILYFLQLHQLVVVEALGQAVMA
jgi:hypothetical protein